MAELKTYVIGVVFNGSWNNKVYYYTINSSVLEKFLQKFASGNLTLNDRGMGIYDRKILMHLPYASITNAQGYTYKNTVKIVELYVSKRIFLDICESRTLVEISKIKVPNEKDTYTNNFIIYGDKNTYTNVSRIESLFLESKSSIDIMSLPDTKLTSIKDESIYVNTSLAKPIISTDRKDNNMKTNLFKGMKIGKIADESVKYSFYGPAFKNAEGDYVAYDANSDSYINVGDMCIDEFSDFIYAIPTPIDQLKKDDVVFIGSKWVRITKDIDEGEKIIDGEQISSGELVSIKPTNNIFGFNFISKLFCMNGFMGDSMSTMLPMMLLMEKSGDNASMKDLMLPMMLMSGTGSKGFENFAQNPMMMYFLMK